MILHFQILDSTNRFCKNNLHVLPDNTLVWAEHQIAGYGKPGNKWFSLPGQAMLISILFKQKVENPAVSSLNTANFLCELVGENFGVQCKLKVPNDIYTETGKLAGVLIETHGSATIVGIGLNIKKLDVYGASALEDFGIDISPFDMVELLSEKIFILRASAFAKKVETIDNEKIVFYRKRIMVQSGHKKIYGIFNGLTENGDIIIDGRMYNNISDFRIANESIH